MEIFTSKSTEREHIISKMQKLGKRLMLLNDVSSINKGQVKVHFEYNDDHELVSSEVKTVFYEDRRKIENRRNKGE